MTLRIVVLVLGCIPDAAGFSSPVIKARLHVGSHTAGRDITRIESDECHANVGCVIDTLQRNYPTILREAPDLSMFAINVVLTHAETGSRLEGLDRYAYIFSMLRFLRNSTMTKDEVTHRVVMGSSACTGGETTIRVRWNAKLWCDLRSVLPGMPLAIDEAPNVHVDGVSTYRLNATGFVTRHELEDVEVTPPALQQAFTIFTSSWAVVGEPVGDVPAPASIGRFFGFLPALDDVRGTGSAGEPGAAPGAAADGSCGLGETLLLDETPMERAARERGEDAEKARRLRELRSPRAEKKRGGLLGALKAPRTPQSCESNYDCERPLVCCDLLVARVCCSSGMMIGAPPSLGLQPELIPVPVPVDADDGPLGGRGGAGARGGGGNGYPPL